MTTYNEDEIMLIEMADTIDSTTAAITLASIAICCLESGKVSKDVFNTVICACADCADDCGGLNDYFKMYIEISGNIK